MRKLTVTMLLLAIVACAHNPGPGEVQAEAAQTPPAPRREMSGARPHPGYVWVAGYWNLVNGRHVWVLGFWTVPPRGSSSWQAARWVHTRDGWLLIRGHWR